jgi:hypothetical protein
VPPPAPGLQLGQVSGVALDSRGNVWVFHRAGRAFDPTATVPIAQATVLELDGDTGALLSSWGAGQFIVPHSVTVDRHDNLWFTDVGRQQVLQFSRDGRLLLAVGERGVSGKDGAHFDQPTDVYVAADRSFYVSDGYNNWRAARFATRRRSRDTSRRGSARPSRPRATRRARIVGSVTARRLTPQRIPPLWRIGGHGPAAFAHSRPPPRSVSVEELRQPKREAG